jgi:hypothetical protein
MFFEINTPRSFSWSTLTMGNWLRWYAKVTRRFFRVIDITMHLDSLKEILLLVLQLAFLTMTNIRHFWVASNSR